MSAAEPGRNEGAGDASLVQTYLSAHSTDSLRAIVDRYSGLVRAVCRLYLRGTPGLADDAARAVFLVMERQSSSLGGQKPLFLAGWLHDVAVLAASSVRAQNHGTSGAEAATAGAPISAAGRESMHDGIRSLPPRLREPLILGCLCGLSDESISGRTSVPQGEVRSRLDNGRLKLCGLLETAGMDATEASVAEWLDYEARLLSEGQKGAKPLVDWKECSAGQPLGKVSQTSGEAADRVLGHMARSAVGRRAGLITAVAAIVAIAAVVTILAVRPKSDATQEKAEVPLQVVSASGTALATVGGQEGQPLKKGDLVPEGAKIRTERNAGLALEHPNGSVIQLRDDAEVTFTKSEQDPVVLVTRGGLVAETKGLLTIRTDQVAASSSGSRLTLLVGKAGKAFTRVDVSRGTVNCVRGEGAGAATAPLALKAGFAACFGDGLPARAQESDGHEYAALGGGVFLRSVMNDYEISGLRLDQPGFAHMSQLWSRRGLDLESHFAGSKTADAEMTKDEEGGFAWTIRAGKGQNTTEETIPIRAEGDVVWVSIQFTVKPGTGPITVDLAGEPFVPDALPANVKQKVSETAGVQSKIEPLTKTTWIVKWALVGALPDGTPLYEYESSFGNGATVKGWRAGTVEKTKIKFSGAEFRIYEIKGGALEKVPVRKAQ